MIERDELAAWLRLLETPQVGRHTARKLLAAFGSPQAAVQASAAAQQQVAGFSLQRSAEAEEAIAALVDTTWAWLHSAPSGAPRGIVTLGDPTYPRPLLETADPPVLLYTQGRVELLQAPGLAIVGSRNPTPQGLENAREFASCLGQAGLVVVSGLALGIDGAAHDGAVATAGGTIAFVGTGLDRVYPARHRELAHRIAQQGLLVSEFPLGTLPQPSQFPQRNRLIAGITLGTLVVEAAVQSGSLITARLATEAGREVFAIPGSIHSPQSRGCHALIKQGAKLVESAADILEELRLGPASAAVAADAEPNDVSADLKEDSLLTALGHEPTSLDALVARTGLAAAALQALLLELELSGQIARLPGQLFQRTGHA